MDVLIPDLQIINRSQNKPWYLTAWCIYL